MRKWYNLHSINDYSFTLLNPMFTALCCVRHTAVQILKIHTETASNASLMPSNVSDALQPAAPVHSIFQCEYIFTDIRHHLTSVTHPGPGMTVSRAGCETDAAVGCPVIRCHASSSMSSQRPARVISHPRCPAFVQHRKIVQARRFFDHTVHLLSYCHSLVGVDISSIEFQSDTTPHTHCIRVPFLHSFACLGITRYFLL